MSGSPAPRGFSRIVVNWRSLAAFSAGEALALIVGTIFPGRRRADFGRLLSIKRIFDQLVWRGDRLARMKGGITLVKVESDTALGPYRVPLRRAGSDVDVFRQVLLWKEYQGVVAVIAARGGPGGIRTIIDAGANIGLTTLFFKRVFPAARVVSLEPDEGNFSLLEQTVALNGLAGVSCLPAALWDGNGPLQCLRGFRDGRSWAVQVADAGADAAGDLQGVTLAEVVSRYGMSGIDLLKIDIEGAEKRIFADPGIKDVLAKTKFIAMEIHEEVVSPEELIAPLVAAGFVVEGRGETFIFSNRALLEQQVDRRAAPGPADLPDPLR